MLCGAVYYCYYCYHHHHHHLALAKALFYTLKDLKERSFHVRKSPHHPDDLLQPSTSLGLPFSPLCKMRVFTSVSSDRAALAISAHSRPRFPNVGVQPRCFSWALRPRESTTSQASLLGWPLPHERSLSNAQHLLPQTSVPPLCLLSASYQA